MASVLKFGILIAKACPHIQAVQINIPASPISFCGKVPSFTRKSTRIKLSIAIFARNVHFLLVLSVFRSNLGALLHRL